MSAAATSSAAPPPPLEVSTGAFALPSPNPSNDGATLSPYAAAFSSEISVIPPEGQPPQQRHDSSMSDVSSVSGAFVFGYGSNGGSSTDSSSIFNAYEKQQLQQQQQQQASTRSSRASSSASQHRESGSLRNLRLSSSISSGIGGPPPSSNAFSVSTPRRQQHQHQHHQQQQQQRQRRQDGVETRSIQTQTELHDTTDDSTATGSISGGVGGTLLGGADSKEGGSSAISQEQAVQKVLMLRDALLQVQVNHKKTMAEQLQKQRMLHQNKQAVREQRLAAEHGKALRLALLEQKIRHEQDMKNAARVHAAEMQALNTDLPSAQRLAVETERAAALKAASSSSSSSSLLSPSKRAQQRAKQLQPEGAGGRISTKALVTCKLQEGFIVQLKRRVTNQEVLLAAQRNALAELEYHRNMWNDAVRAAKAAEARNAKLEAQVATAVQAETMHAEMADFYHEQANELRQRFDEHNKQIKRLETSFAVDLRRLRTTLAKTETQNRVQLGKVTLLFLTFLDVCFPLSLTNSQSHAHTHSQQQQQKQQQQQQQQNR
jgi:hypothetical protein